MATPKTQETRSSKQGSVRECGPRFCPYTKRPTYISIPTGNQLSSIPPATAGFTKETPAFFPVGLKKKIHLFSVEHERYVSSLGHELDLLSVEVLRYRHIHAHRVGVLVPPVTLRGPVVVYLLSVGLSVFVAQVHQPLNSGVCDRGRGRRRLVPPEPLDRLGSLLADAASAGSSACCYLCCCNPGGVEKLLHSPRSKTLPSTPAVIT